MTRAQVLKLARAKWGERYYLRYDRRASAKTERDAASALLKAHRAAKPATFLIVDDAREWRKRDAELLSIIIRHPYSVGYTEPYFGAFCIQGSGDTWDEAAAKAGLIPQDAPNVEATR